MRSMAAKVTLPGPFSMRPEFDDFLFAPIGKEANGMSLSVVSALARLGIDPWKEAGRLSALSKESAAATLDQLIARLPGEQWQRLDRTRIVARLVELLPRDAPAREAGPPGSEGRRHPNLLTIAWLIGLLLVGSAALFVERTNRDRLSSPASIAAPLSSDVAAPVPQSQ
jgi:hypothetical protein